jgi:3-hydroxymyristoyl/3-hydroxydecanoyl-(acyl carrier protein) dehydratase
MVASVRSVIAQSTAFQHFHLENSVVRGKISSHSPYLNGHFPGMPVFPAVGIVDASLHFVKLVTRKADLQLAGLPNAKFVSPIAPEQNLRIEIKALDAPNTWQLEWKDEPSLKTLATLRLSVI